MYSNFVYSLEAMDFAQYSENFTLPIEDAKCSIQKTRHIIVGGELYEDDLGFYEVILDKRNQDLSYKSFIKDYNKPNATLTKVGMEDKTFKMNCFLSKDNKYLVIFSKECYYNVYDMVNDKWLLNKSFRINFGPSWNDMDNFYYDDSDDTPKLMINDELFVVFKWQALHFYSIMQDIRHPIFIDTFKMESIDGCPRNTYKMDTPRMHCTSFGKENISRNKIRYNFELVLFVYDFHFVVLKFNICLELNNVKTDKEEWKLDVEQKKIDIAASQLENIEFESDIDSKRVYDFNSHIIHNVRKEAIMAIIGGTNNDQSIILLNIITKKIEHFNNVLPFECEDVPSVFGIQLNNNCKKIVLMQNHNYTHFNIYSWHYDWNILRLIWIGYHKNRQNNLCYFSLLPRDIINHLTHFLINDSIQIKFNIEK